MHWLARAANEHKFAPAEAALAKLCSNMFKPGTNVELFGLTTATILNGKRGVVVVPSDEAACKVMAGRVMVLLTGASQPKAVKVENLKVL